MLVRIEKKPPFRVAGRRIRISGQDSGTSGAFWAESRRNGLVGQLKALADKTERKVTGSDVLGVSCAERDPEDRSFWFFIAAELGEGDCPPGLEPYTVPEGSWAVFRNSGELPGALADAKRYALLEWLPSSPYCRAPAPELEAYPADSSADVEFWLPVMPKRPEEKPLPFREMRRKRQLLSPEETEAILRRGTAGVLAVSGDGGYPYAVPLSYVYAKGRIFFHCAKTGHKLDAIRRCEKVSFCVVDRDEVKPEEYTTYFRSAIVFGKARILEDDAEKRAAIELLAEKYCPADPEGRRREIEREYRQLCMVEITMDRMTGKEAIELVRAGGAK